MKQQIAIITLGINNINRSKRFYIQGFGWSPVHEDNNTIMYKMNDFILSTWLRHEFDADMQRANETKNASFSLGFAVQKKLT